MRNYLLVIVFCLFATTIFAQNNLTGTWNTGEQNTLVKIHEVDSVYVGEIISSDNPEVKLGKVIVKDFKQDGDEWVCQLFAAKRKKWFNAEIEIEDGKLKISVGRGFHSKTVEWEKVETKEVINSDNLAE
jgi:uncharacterized protein (DUF2147 family)